MMSTTAPTKTRPLVDAQGIFDMTPLIRATPLQLHPHPEDVSVIADYRVAVVAKGVCLKNNDAVWEWLLKGIREVLYAKYPDVFIAVRPFPNPGATDIDLDNTALSINRYDSITDLKQAGSFDLVFLGREEALTELTYIESLDKTYVVVEKGYAQVDARAGHTLGSPCLISKLGFLEVVFTSVLKALSNTATEASPDDRGILEGILSGFCGSLIGKTPEYTCDIPAFFRKWSTANMEDVQ